jgi:predicted ATPase/two-component SAPR family response regulator/Tfp pilus assembly protein PilF
MTRLFISLLGPFQVALKDERITDFATDKARALLAYLAVEANRPHRREVLAELLWPDQPPRKARQSVRQALSHLRQAIGDQDSATPFLQVSREAIQFNLESDHWLDVVAFTALITACSNHPHRRIETCQPCMGRLEEAVELYRGGFLEHFFASAGHLFEEWALLKREWLHRQVMEALFYLTEYHERRGEYEQARQYAWRQIELEPWYEDAHRQLIRLLASSGQRSAALAQYETCRRVLVDELGAEPTPETTALYERVRAGEAPSRPTPAHNLPSALTPFVGRQQELEMLSDWLANPRYRLVTLVGPGGIGKSRLALRAAAEQRIAFAHGVYLVSLAPINAPEFIVSTIADALGFSFSGRRDTQEQLLNYLREKEILLLLDNMEHLLDGTGFLVEILQRAPGVVLLVTSRERLNLPQERVYEVRGLAYPKNGAAGEGDVDAVQSYSAVELFTQSARRIRWRFALSERTAPWVAHICRLVEGMPLGIELAASGMAALSCEEIAHEIQRNLDVLATSLRNIPQRHRSLWATFEHSWDLLTEPERQAFARLSVFRGGFEGQAAAQVAGASQTLLTTLEHKSLLRCEASGRYQVHQLLRQYGAEKLDQLAQQREVTHNRHSDYYAAFVREREDALRGAGQQEALEGLRLEIDNARAAWRWAIERGRYEVIEKALAGLAFFYDMQGGSREGEVFFGRAAQALRGTVQGTAHEIILGRLLARQGAFARYLSEYDQANRLLKQALAILGDGTDAAFSLNYLGEVARLQCKYEQAQAHHQAAKALCEQNGDAWEMALCLSGLGSVAYRQGAYERAMAYYRQGLAIRQELGDQRGVGHSLNDLGVTTYRMGDYEQAHHLLSESLAVRQGFKDYSNIPPTLNNLGLIADVLGQYEKAKELYQQSLVIRRETGERWGIALGLNNLGVVSHRLGEYEEARHYHQQSLAICREMDDSRGISNALNNLGLVAEALREFERAERLYREALAIREEIGDRRGIGWSFYHLGYLAHLRGDHAQAEQWLQESLEIWHELGDPWGLLFAMNGMGHTAVALGKPQEARACLGQVMEKALARRTVAVALRALVGWAALVAQAGELERAVELLTLVRRHPATEHMTQDQADRLLAGLAPGLSPQQQATAEERGRTRTLQEIVEEIAGR